MSDSTSRKARRKVSSSWLTASVPTPHATPAEQDDLHGVHHPAADPKLHKFSALGSGSWLMKSALRDAPWSPGVMRVGVLPLGSRCSLGPRLAQHRGLGANIEALGIE